MVYQISAEDLKARMDKGEPLVLIDVRQPWEHDAAHLAESVLIPLGELPQRSQEVPQSETALVVVYCHHGVRSLSGAALLEAAGFENVASLAGGIDRWSTHINPGIPRY